MTDLQVEKIIKMLQESSYTNYYIAKKTGLSNSTLKNYKEKKTKLTNVLLSTKILISFVNLRSINLMILKNMIIRRIFLLNTPWISWLK